MKIKRKAIPNKQAQNMPTQDTQNLELQALSADN
jgi:hypothetical protein